MEKKEVTGEEAAIAIQFSVALPHNRSLGFTTFCFKDAPDSEFHALLQRLSNAADVLQAAQQLRSLRYEEETYVRELSTNRQNQANYMTAAEVDFAARGRQGPLVLTGSQEAAMKGFKTSEDGLTVKITKIREQIAEQEQLIKAA